MARSCTQLAPIHRGMPTENKQKRTPLITQKTSTTKDLEHDYLMEFRGSSPPCQGGEEKSGSSVAGPDEAGNACTHLRIDASTHSRKAQPSLTGTITDCTAETPRAPSHPASKNLKPQKAQKQPATDGDNRSTQRAQRKAPQERKALPSPTPQEKRIDCTAETQSTPSIPAPKNH